MAERIDPLPYIYDKDNEKMNSIIDLIKSFCGIDENNDKYPTDPEKLWPLIWQTLRIISSITCWDDMPEDLFLTQTRLQSYPVTITCKGRCCAKCDDQFVIVPLEYLPHPQDFIVAAKISGVINGQFVSKDLDIEELMKGYNKAKGHLYIPKTEFYDLITEYDECCKCDYKMDVELEYNAGYDVIPKGILPIICYILNKVNNSVDEEDCHDNLTTTSGLLKRKKVGNVEYEWSVQDTTNAKTATLYSDLHDLGMLDEIMAISRCYLATQEEVLGDVV